MCVQEIRVCKANILIWREMHAIKHFFPESLEMGKQLAKGACVWHVMEESPLALKRLPEMQGLGKCEEVGPRSGRDGGIESTSLCAKRRSRRSNEEAEGYLATGTKKVCHQTLWPSFFK